jgi:hypothetical protein
LHVEKNNKFLQSFRDLEVAFVFCILHGTGVKGCTDLRDRFAYDNDRWYEE